MYRDKYMFHQANVIKTNTPTGEKSLLEYWYEIVLAKIAQFINTDVFPIKVCLNDDFLAVERELIMNILISSLCR